MPTIRIAAWNLGEGSFCGNQLTCLNAISQCLFSSNIDIVLLNEVCIWNAWTNSGVNQIAWLAQRGGYPYVEQEQAATLFLRGGKYVAVLSRFPLLSKTRIQHSAYPDGGGYATVQVTANINNRRHHIFSSRFTAYDVNENLRSHDALRTIITAIPDDEAVIFGGDFNTGAGGVTNWPATVPRTVAYRDFATATRLRHVLGAPGWTENDRPIDHLLVRGPYVFSHAARVDPTSPNPSDHPWVIAELTPIDYERVGPEDELIGSDPGVCSWAAGRLDVFTRGTDHALWHKVWAGSGWSGWEQLGANEIASDPAAVSWGPNRIDVFVRGTDSGLYHKWWDGSSWSGYERVGSELISSSPAVCSWAAGRLDVFARGTDDALWHKVWAGGGWSGWGRVASSPVPSDPIAVSWGPNRIDVFVRGTDSTLFHKWWDGTWRP